MIESIHLAKETIQQTKCVSWFSVFYLTNTMLIACVECVLRTKRAKWFWLTWNNFIIDMKKIGWQGMWCFPVSLHTTQQELWYHGTPCHSKWFESQLPRWGLTTFKGVNLHFWFQIMKRLKAVMDCRWFCLQGEEVQPVDCFVQEGMLTKALVIFVSCISLLY